MHGEESRYHHVRVGMNGRLDTIQAAVLLEKLAVFDSEIEMRQEVASRYFEGLRHCDGIVLPHISEHNQSVFAQFTIRVSNRDQFRSSLQEAGVPTAVHYPLPIYKQPAYAESGTELKESDRASHEVVSLPFSPWLSIDDQSRVIQAV